MPKDEKESPIEVKRTRGGWTFKVMPTAFISIAVGIGTFLGVDGAGKLGSPRPSANPANMGDAAFAAFHQEFTTHEKHQEKERTDQTWKDKDQDANIDMQKEAVNTLQTEIAVANSRLIAIEKQLGKLDDAIDVLLQRVPARGP